MLAKPWLTSNSQELGHCLRAQSAGKQTPVSKDVILQKSLCVFKQIGRCVAACTPESWSKDFLIRFYPFFLVFKCMLTLEYFMA